MFILWFIISALSIIYLVIDRYSRNNRLFSKIPGPGRYPLIGNILLVMKSDRSEQWLAFCELMRKYYPISIFWILHKPIVNVYHPDDLKILLSSQKAIEKGFIYKYLEPWLQTGLLTSTNEKWRNRRKMLTPAFHLGTIKLYTEIITEQAGKMIESLKRDNETMKDILPIFSNYTLNIICEAAMGVTLDKTDPLELNQYKKSIHAMGDIVVYRILRPYLINSIFRYVPKMGPLQTKSLRILHDFTDKVVQRRKEYHKNEGDKFLNDYNSKSIGLIYDNSDTGVSRKRLALLDLLLAAEKKGTIDGAGIKEEVDTFVLEGHDVTSIALTFTVLLLAENKEVQDRARDEVTSILDRAKGKAGFAMVQEFQYLERCIMESLRLFPPIPIIQRRTKEELQLKHALIPADTNIMVHIWRLHRDSNFWTEPDKFDPDRFLPENLRNRHPFCYIPFSAGPRNCIGQKFAMMELKLILSYILYDFYLKPIDRTDDLPLVADLLLRPRDPIYVKFIKINK